MDDSYEPGCPIRKSQDHNLVTSSPGLIASSYVLHRLLTPRHPSRALNDLIASTECRDCLDYSSSPGSELITTPLHLRGLTFVDYLHSQVKCSRLAAHILLRLLTAFRFTSTQVKLEGSCFWKQILDICTLSSVVKDISTVSRGLLAKLWRGKDSDFRIAVNAFARSFEYFSNRFGSCLPKARGIRLIAL